METPNHEKFQGPESDSKLDSRTLAVAEALQAGDNAVFIAWNDEQSAEIDRIADTEGNIASLRAIATYTVTKARIFFQAGILEAAREECETVLQHLAGNDVPGSTAYEDAMELLYRIQQAEGNLS